MKKKNIEWSILISSVILCIIGMIALFSATHTNGYAEFMKQIIWFIVGISIAVIFANINYNFLTRISPAIYGVFIILLVAVLFTEEINGASSWFNLGAFSFQPGEFAKIFVIIFLSYVITKIQERYQDEINKPLKLILILLVIALPMFLIILEPDYGTGMCFLVFSVLILFIAGINKKYIMISVLLIALLAPVVYNFILPQHAKTRIEIFLNPESEPRGAGYNVLQSKLAFGSGQFLGMGLLKGNQTQLGYLYPKDTDFIFSVISEEMGFIVSTIVIVLNVILVTKALYVAKTAKDDEGAYIAAGIAGIWLFHMTENIGMTMGLLPITGVPLSFVSYGGSSLIMNFICVGILVNISGQRHRNMF